MSWHAENRSKDGKMCHPSDSPAWRNVDCRWPEFGREARNICLGLAADGINPHNNGLNNRYSCWPVMLVMYNLPPWLCMKRKFMMLSTLISGTYAPENNIDIYLQPMIDDLKKLWEKEEPNVYDAQIKYVFTLKAVLMWTVNDFPGYGNLSGCINKGYKACPVYGDNVVARYLSHSRKMCYLGHRRYLDEHHPYRRQQIAFDGQQELGYAPEPLNGEEVLMQQQQLEFSFGKGGRRKRFNKILKSYVQNRFYPEDCIAEGYLKEESAEFCTGFFRESSRTTGLQKDDDKFSGPVGRVTMKSVAEKERDEEHLAVLLNNPEVEPYIRWLIVSIEMRENYEAVSEIIRWLAEKPSFSVLTYEGYIFDGVRYHTKERDNARVVQNSGVSLVARTVQVSSAKDVNSVESELTFYEIVQEICELDYHAFKAPLFLCTWTTTDRGVKSDDLGFTRVNFNRPGHKQDKFASVDQVSQVFYVEDPCDAYWSVVFSSTTRDYHDVYNEDVEEETSWNPPPFCYDIPMCDPITCDDDASVSNKRQNVEGIWVKKS
ncbi:uncharacterized protein LOC141714955 [Apium graveolens]|uniref:uncharacterized protein LOC141714955 n=1 Tax=Apium graveolens TaxID=4045 RepID=UPI003D7A96A8